MDGTTAKHERHGSPKFAYMRVGSPTERRAQRSETGRGQIASGVNEKPFLPNEPIARPAGQCRKTLFIFWPVPLNPGVIEVVQRSGLGERLGRERMSFSPEQTVESYQKQFSDSK